MFNPLLDAEIKPVSWNEITGALNDSIAKYAKRGDVRGAQALLAELFFYDPEAVAYWQEIGFAVYQGKERRRDFPKNVLPDRQGLNFDQVLSGENPII